MSRQSAGTLAGGALLVLLLLPVPSCTAVTAPTPIMARTDPTASASRGPKPGHPGVARAMPMPPPAFRTAEEAARLLDEISATRSYTRGQPARVTVAPDGSAVYFLRSEGKSRVQNL